MAHPEPHREGGREREKEGGRGREREGEGWRGMDREGYKPETIKQVNASQDQTALLRGMAILDPEHLTLELCRVKTRYVELRRVKTRNSRVK